MDARLFDFLSTHGTAVVLASTLVAVTGIVQWRKARVAELDLALMEDLLEQGLSAAEIQSLLQARAATDMGLLKQLSDLFANALKQFGALSHDDKGLLVTPFLMAAMMGLPLFMISTSFQDNQDPKSRVNRAHDFQADGFALTPEQLIVFLDETGAGNCRVYLTECHAVHDFQMVAAVSAQDNPESELRVETTPIAVRQSEGGSSQPYCDVRLQAVRGPGHFTVQLTAIYKYRQQAQTTFSVHVGPSQPMASPSDRSDDSPSDGWL